MNRYKGGLLAGSLLVIGLVLGGVGATFARTSSSSPPPSATAYPGWSTGNGYGPGGMMGTPGPGGMMGPSCPGGMMGNYGPGGMWSCYPGGMLGGSPQGKTLTLAQAQQNVQRYIGQFGNPNLALDEILEFQRNFYAIVADKSTGHGAFEVLVNKATGAVFPEYGPAMMWNTTYGMMRSMMGYQQPNGPMTVSAAQATQIAQQWLAQHQPGATTEAPDQFPGYYTLHIRKSGTVTGMLSVNGYSGQVWYHTWHGAFIRMKDLHA